MGLVGRAFDWLMGRDPIKPPNPDRVVEAAWLPLWQAQLVLHELWERELPATMAEDHTSLLRYAAREPMARIFVMEDRLVEIRAAIAEITGTEPPNLDR
jgi:hypothetical protein